mmetsp:Transcript_25162/g.53459  ORF Transcript_25162/g.53459 Transcript_25162/m.53459 type:complete len:275 (-) Transcript_25162:425-1249(-)
MQQPDREGGAQTLPPRLALRARAAVRPHGQALRGAGAADQVRGGRAATEGGVRGEGGADRRDGAVDRRVEARRAAGQGAVGPLLRRALRRQRFSLQLRAQVSLPLRGGRPFGKRRAASAPRLRRPAYDTQSVCLPVRRAGAIAGGEAAGARQRARHAVQAHGHLRAGDVRGVLRLPVERGGRRLLRQAWARARGEQQEDAPALDRLAGAEREGALLRGDRSCHQSRRGGCRGVGDGGDRRGPDWRENGPGRQDCLCERDDRARVRRAAVEAFAC